MNTIIFGNAIFREEQTTLITTTTTTSSSSSSGKRSFYDYVKSYKHDAKGGMNDDEDHDGIGDGGDREKKLYENTKFLQKHNQQKQVPEHMQIVVDDQGRRRFHGAFQGGFSAGYYNTCGSEDGFTPQSFKSSRADANKGKRSITTLDDIMDEEDRVNIYGAETLQTKSDFGSYDQKFPMESQGMNEDPLFGRLFSKETHQHPPTKQDQLHSGHLHLFDDLFLSSDANTETENIGLKLLKKMGWSHTKEQSVVNKKVYTVTLPPHLQKNKNQSVSSLDQIQIDNLIANMKPKFNLHGIGYIPSAVTSTNITTTTDTPIPKIATTRATNRATISADIGDDQNKFDLNSIRHDQTGNGYGGYDEDEEEEDDDDIGSGILRRKILREKKSKIIKLSKVLTSKNTNNQKYDMALYDIDISRSKSTTSHHESTISSLSTTSTITSAAVNQKNVQFFKQLCRNGKPPLRGFHLATRTVNDYSLFGGSIDAEYKAPEIPPDFLPIHKAIIPQRAQHVKKLEKQKKQLTYEQRGKLLGEEMLSRNSNRPLFQPNPEEKNLQENLTKYISEKFIMGKEQDLSQKKEDENDIQFGYNPALKPTTTKSGDKAKEEKSQKKGIIVKRQVFDWHPESLLCKRFALPQPYPSSTTKGTVYPVNHQSSTAVVSGTNAYNQKSISIFDDSVFGRSGTPTTNDEDDIETPGYIQTTKKDIESSDIAKPSLDIFKAIFEEEEDDDHNKGDNDKENSKSNDKDDEVVDGSESMISRGIRENIQSVPTIEAKKEQIEDEEEYIPMEDDSFPFKKKQDNEPRVAKQRTVTEQDIRSSIPDSTFKNTFIPSKPLNTQLYPSSSAKQHSKIDRSQSASNIIPSTMGLLSSTDGLQRTTTEIHSLPRRQSPKDIGDENDSESLSSIQAKIAALEKVLGKIESSEEEGETRSKKKKKKKDKKKKDKKKRKKKKSYSSDSNSSSTTGSDAASDSNSDGDKNEEYRKRKRKKSRHG